ncbi:hypothetical protein L3Y34_003328 [Caenorhabditis briggsae]|uniref:F-box domain-containing protein n=1 Tax=Caenorhabditis briggsae TaxID=6238 RepID=A0AAE9AA43_CAEBR|nr:hypothetical protein L3Y34_003328 [Caenorhabditis briggsae]
MSSHLKNLTENFENLAINPIFNTNWCDMPAEIKVECVGKMELTERLSLRSTAKAERSLVDSQKINIRRCAIHGLPEIRRVTLASKTGKIVFRAFRSANKEFEFLKYIWKIGVFENLYIWLDGKDSKEKLENFNGTIAAKSIDFHFCDEEFIVAILGKVKNGVESITMNADRGISYSVNEILKISHVQNVKYWQIDNYKRMSVLWKVAQVWIDISSKIGTTFQLSTEVYGLFHEFLQHFVDRIVSISQIRVRIRTNHPDRHILLELEFDGFVEFQHSFKFFRLMVISAKMEESEYEDNCRKWIRRMKPEFYVDDM